MSGVHELSRRDARRIAVRAQLLTATRPTDLVETVRRLSLVQVEPTSAVAPSAELVLWSRLGPRFSPRELWDAVDEQRLVQLHQTLRVPEDVALLRVEMADQYESGGTDGWVQANDDFRRDLLDRLRTDGPLPAAELPDSCLVPWTSSGWNHQRNVRMMLNQLVARGEVAASAGTGRERLWDLASRVYPDDPLPPASEALPALDRRRLESLGIARATTTRLPVEPVHVHEAGEPAVVEGVRGTWRVDPAQLAQPFTGRAALLSPFDRLLADRKRLAELFGFEYLLEMYKPAEARRWGYYALPVLYDDRLVGKLDATADREAGELRVRALHEDEPFTDAMTAAVGSELDDLAQWLGLEVVHD